VSEDQWTVASGQKPASEIGAGASGSGGAFAPAGTAEAAVST
jgi:hypothetical protein